MECEQTYLDNCRIEFAALDKLFIRQLGVLILVHVLEDLVHPLKHSRRLSGQLTPIHQLWQNGTWTGI